MVLEQSIDLETKTKGGIVGMSTKEDAVDQWFLIIHERAFMTHAPKMMCGLENYDRIGTHREAKATRVSRDERGGLQHLASYRRNAKTLSPVNFIRTATPEWPSAEGCSRWRIRGWIKSSVSNSSLFRSC